MTESRSIQVVLVEGDRPARILMERSLPPSGEVGVAITTDASVAGEVLDRDRYDVVRLDHEKPEREGTAPLRVMRGSGLDREMVLISEGDGESAGEPALEAEAAYGFLTRPLDPEELNRLVAEVEEGELLPPVRVNVGGIVGSGPALAAMLDTVARVAPSSASVLIQGETGTGKSLVARALHELSGRNDKPFVVVNCSAFQETLLESELFGHEKGAFTGAVTAKQGLFEVAHTGTLFLDEVAEMSPAMQAKLLQVLDDGELRRVGGTRGRRVDVRVISATNKDLEAAVGKGDFRRDLLFRLNVIALTVPPLRERREDIPELVAHFLGRFRPKKGISPAALRLMTEYRWPGNVRELANTLEGLALLAAGDDITPLDLPPGLRPASDFELEKAETPLPMSEIERLHIKRTLTYTQGKKAPAARLLGIDVKTLSNKIKNYKIEL